MSSVGGRMTSATESKFVELESYIVNKYFEESDKLKQKHGLSALSCRHKGDEAYVVYCDLMNKINQIKAGTK